MKRWIIKRHGANGANQHAQLVRVLGTVQAVDAVGARAAAAEKWTLYNNQIFEALDLAGRTRSADRDAARNADCLDPIT